MNSIWNKNIELFESRFPQLALLLESYVSLFKKYAGTGDQQNLYSFWKIIPTRTEFPTAEENALKLHSAYNPVKESQNVLKASEKVLSESEAVAFFGAGLGYTVSEVAKLFPQKTIIWIEPDADHFFSAMLFCNLEAFFKSKNPVIAVSCTPDQTITLLNQNGILNTYFFNINAHTVHNQPYFDAVKTLAERNRSKEKINQATLERFGKRWNENCRKNSCQLNRLSGIRKFKDSYKGKKFLMLAAGPSLEQILPHLNELKKTMTVVAVDTALKACLRHGVEPNFIVLTDPQYWAYRHIAGLKSPSSTLITEIAVYPAVFRFKCRQIVLCNSQVPMAKDYQKTDFGDLGAGGSVASSAWNFCAYCGASEIYVAGLDLSFPANQTHTRGSTFEENVHARSKRISTAETASLPMLFSGNVCTGKDYMGNPVLTDQRMKMFAWWFESRLAEMPEVKTYTFAPQGLAIPGITPVSISSLISL